MLNVVYMPDFKRGYIEGGINVEEHEGFGPDMKFRNSSIKNWNRVLTEAEKRLENK